MTTYAEYQRYRDQPRAQAAPATGHLAPTTPDIEGPFYLSGAPPLMDDGKLCDYPTLVLSGRVSDTTGNPVMDAVLDFWQADVHGNYDEAGYKFRGKVVAALDERGAVYRLQTIRPGDYKITDNPPDFRCAHIHVKVTADGFKPLTTQLYFKADPYNATDHWFSQDRVIQVNDMLRPGEGRFDFVLERTA